MISRRAWPMNADLIILDEIRNEQETGGVSVVRAGGWPAELAA